MNDIINIYRDKYRFLKGNQLLLENLKAGLNSPKEIRSIAMITGRLEALETEREFALYTIDLLEKIYKKQSEELDKDMERVRCTCGDTATEIIMLNAIDKETQDAICKEYGYSIASIKREFKKWNNLLNKKDE